MENIKDQDSILVLPDQRQLGYAELGDPQGHPVFCFHGSPGSRLVFSSEDEFIQLPGFRFILPDRPGYGLSDPKPDRTLIDWADDVKALADHLNLDTFTVLGESGGGPHALACGYALPKRIHSVFLFASPSPAGFKGASKGLPLDYRIGLFLSKFFPGVIKWIIRSQSQSFLKGPEKYLKGFAPKMGLPDQRLLEKKEMFAALIRDMKEAYTQGGEGHATDSLLAMTSSSWGFALSEVQVPVYLWHGMLDTLVSKVMAEHLASTLPNCKARYVDNAGHLLTYLPEVVVEVGDVLRSAVSKHQ